MPTLNLGRVGFVNKGTWLTSTAYKINDTVTYLGGTYVALQANTGQTPIFGGTVYWQEWVANNVVHKSGDETIADVKTFTSSPIIPTPADGDSSTKAASTKFVAAAIPYNINAATSKATPADADEFGFLSSSAAWSLVKMTGTNLKAWLKTYFDTVYAVLNSPIFSGSISAKNAMYKDTPVTVTSWSYVTTTITLNVASHTFVTGDYIEVGGLTAATNTPNGVHLVTSVTATTIVFTYALAPTGTAGVSSATVKGYMTTNGRVESIGVGQTWQDVTASRAAGTTYTNSTGKPIMVSIEVSSSATNALIIDGITISEISDSDGMGSTVQGIVPNNSTYLLSVGGATTLEGWKELR